MQAVIYLFRCPKGRAYAGWRGVSPEALRTWPHRGAGPLPCGYIGSGVAWLPVARRHRKALEWRILARVDGDRADVDAAERRAIRLARAVLGERCLNILSGGEGMTSEDARALWVDPDFAERVKRGIKGAMAQPSTKAKTLRHLEALHADPGWQERRAAGLAKAREAAAAPEVRARANASNKATHKALAQTPERRALFSRAARIGHRKRRTRKALAPFLHPPLSDTPGLTVWLAPPGSPLGITTP